MKTLTIKDLPVAEELDRKAMASIQGGMCGACGPYSPSGYSPGYPSSWSPQPDVTKNDFNFNASQSLNQSQNTLVNNGNNAAFVSGITANVHPTQNGSNNIKFA